MPLGPKKRWLLPIALVSFLLVAYWHALSLAFLNDDYFFLEQVRDRSFWNLWGAEHLQFHWYRPWSREFHYWSLSRLLGLSEPRFHAVSFALWLLVMVFYFKLVERITNRHAAAVSVAGLALLGLWGGPLLWIAGAQDLWMLFFGLLFLHAVLSDRVVPGLLALGLALLSKETAAVLPAVATALERTVGGRTLREALRRTWAFWAGAAVWLVLHPTLRERFSGNLDHTLETENRPSSPAIVVKTLLAQFNLDAALAPESGWGLALLRGALSGAFLVGLVWVLCRAHEEPPASSDDSSARRRVLIFGAIWATLGFAILLLPSIGWHAYYGVLGSLGFWLALGAGLSRHRRIAIVTIAVLALLRGARADTPSWDWGTDWYQTRAGILLGDIRNRLFRFHPAVPARSRFYFARIPNNIGLLAGDGPALRIWYNDPSLRALYYSAYMPRSPDDSLGEDYFFRFDTVQVLVEIKHGPERMPEAVQLNPGWQRDHEVLASMFIRAGNVSGAAAEYAKLAGAFPQESEYALYAAAAHEALGEHEAAARHYKVAAASYGDSAARRMTDELLGDLPRPRAR